MSRPKTARLSRIRIYPIKSLEGVDVERAVLNGFGGLKGDREYRILDELGRVINTKRVGEAICKLRYEVKERGRVFEFGEDAERYWLPDDINELSFRFTSWFGQNVRMERNQATGFPDDLVASGPTIVSRATLLEVASWFHWDEDETRRRFRANLELDDVPAFWEDGLFGEKGEERLVRIGDAKIEAMQPCSRCAVPSRDPDTGEIEDPAFAKTFAERRRETLPQWARPSRFDHYYRLAVNTRVPVTEAGKSIAVGDVVELAQ